MMVGIGGGPLPMGKRLAELRRKKSWLLFLLKIVGTEAFEVDTTNRNSLLAQQHEKQGSC